MNPPRPHLLWIARFDYRGGLRVVEHTHTFHQCLLVLRGEAHVRLDGADFRVKPSDLLWLPPGTRHGWSVDPDQFLETLDMKFSLAAPERIPKLPPGAGVLPARKDLEAVFRALFATARSGPEQRHQRCALILEAFLLQLTCPPAAAEGSWETSPAETEAAGLVQVLEQQFAEQPQMKWTADAIAARMHLSYRRISQLCQEQSRQTPMHLLREVRIRKARELLRYGDVAIKEVAELTGFESLHHFSRCFKEVTGVSPAAWRKREREKTPASVEVSPGFHNRIRISGLEE